MVKETDRQPMPDTVTSNDCNSINNSENSSANQLVENDKPVHTSNENTKEFLNFDFNNYKAINVVDPKKTNIEEYDDMSYKLMTFVLGVLATIDKSKNRDEVKDLICSGASDFLFEGEIQFRWKKAK
jgi:hypothetical protein